MAPAMYGENAPVADYVITAVLHTDQEKISLLVSSGIPITVGGTCPEDFVYIDQPPRFDPFHYKFDVDPPAHYPPISLFSWIHARKPRHTKKWPVLDVLFLDHSDKNMRGAFKHLFG